MTIQTNYRDGTLVFNNHEEERASTPPLVPLHLTAAALFRGEISPRNSDPIIQEHLFKTWFDETSLATLENLLKRAGAIKEKKSPLEMARLLGNLIRDTIDEGFLYLAYRLVDQMPMQFSYLKDNALFRLSLAYSREKLFDKAMTCAEKITDGLIQASAFCKMAYASNDHETLEMARKSAQKATEGPEDKIGIFEEIKHTGEALCQKAGPGSLEFAKAGFSSFSEEMATNAMEEIQLLVVQREFDLARDYAHELPIHIGEMIRDLPGECRDLYDFAIGLAKEVKREAMPAIDKLELKSILETTSHIRGESEEETLCLIAIELAKNQHPEKAAFVANFITRESLRFTLLQAISPNSQFLLGAANGFIDKGFFNAALALVPRMPFHKQNAMLDDITKHLIAKLHQMPFEKALFDKAFATILQFSDENSKLFYLYTLAQILTDQSELREDLFDQVFGAISEVPDKYKEDNYWDLVYCISLKIYPKDSVKARQIAAPYPIILEMLELEEATI